MEEKDLLQLLELAKRIEGDKATIEEVGEAFTFLVEKLREAEEKQSEINETIGELIADDRRVIADSIKRLGDLKLSTDKVTSETKEEFRIAIKDAVAPILERIEAVRNSIPEIKDVDLSNIEKSIEELRNNLPEIVEETPEETRDKLEKLKGDERLDKEAIKGWEDFIDKKTLDRAIGILDQRTIFLLNKDYGAGGGPFDSHRPTTRAGIPVVTVNGDTVIDFLEGYFFPPNRPTVVLATDPASGIRESGNDVTSVDLTPTTTMGAFPITSLSLTGTNGYSYSYPSPNPSGGTEPTQTDSIGFTTTSSYTATVSDGTNSDTDTKTFTYTFPYYKGVGVKNLTGIATDGGTLTKVVALNPFPVAISYTTVNQVPYLVYPASYGYLKKVLDVNGFDVSPDWGTQAGGPNTDIVPWSTISVTNSFGVAVSCYAYQFANLASTTMQYTFSK